MTRVTRVTRIRGSAPALSIELSRRHAAVLLLALFDVLLAATALFPVIRSDGTAVRSILGALVLVIGAQLAVLGSRTLPKRAVEVVARKQHFLPAIAQFLLVLYWGLWWDEVYRHLPIVLAQLFLAYLLDMLIAWARRQTWQAGFGPVPIVLSLNFYIWFKPDHLYLQLAMVAIAYGVKTLVTREVDGRRRHIFNPSGVPLALLAVYLLATNAYAQTYGTDFIYSFYIPPNMIECIFLLAALSNAAFATTLVTAGAGVTMLLLDTAIVALAGAPLLTRPFDPLVLIGAGLLVTDPSTSPSNRSGKLLFGCLYGLTTYAFVATLHLTSHPGYFDKVLAVPVVNAFSPLLDSVGFKLGRWLKPRVGQWASLLRSNKLHLALWALIFIWAVPLLKIDRRPTLVPIPQQPETALTEKMARENMLVGQRCQTHPRMCGRFGFLAELDYWIRDGR